jgi:hypothetical protein
MALLLESCAGTECNFHSQCDRQHYCQGGMCLQDCTRDFDCPAGEVCSAIGRCGAPVDGGPAPDAGPTPDDAGPMTMPDTGPPPLDGGPPPPTDGGPPPPDGGPPPPDTGPRDSGPVTGTGRYLDRCTRGADCTSGTCADDIGGSMFCTRACSTHGDCADEHACFGGVCAYDDTGVACPVSTPAACNTGACYGPAGGTGRCTRTCASARDCPAGYACADAGGGTFVCVDIEQPCTAAADCLTGICIPGIGCTSACRSAADCPSTFAGLEYTCALSSGTRVCTPSTFVVGSDPIGAICRLDGLGNYLCRGGACGTPPDFPGTPPDMCTQACDEEGGCGPGLGCYPIVDVAGIILACVRAGGRRALGASCARAADCDSAICDAPSGRCSRLCADGLCPTGWRCETVPGFTLRICRP